MLAFALTNWKYLVIAALFAAVAFLYLTKSTVTAERDLARQNLVACQEVNASNVATTEALKSEVKTTADTCAKRLKLKDTTIKQLQAIDSMQGGGGDATTGSGNAVIDALNGMYR